MATSNLEKFIEAAIKGDLETIKKLFTIDSSLIDKRLEYDEKAALQHASDKGHLEVCKFLLDKGAKINANYFYDNPCCNDSVISGSTALGYAAHNKNKELCQFLISRGADLNLTPYNAHVPLINAVYQNDLEMCRFFIELGADINITPYSYSHVYPITVAASLYERIEILKYLIEKGADVNKLQIRYLSKPESIIEIIIENYKEPQVILEILELLIKKGAKILPESLICAINKQNIEISKFLIENGADVNIQISNQNALHHAILQENIEICSLIVNSKQFKPCDNKNALNFAKQNNKESLYDFLLALDLEDKQYCIIN
eukprot:TRINITY_DN769_c0_g1_i1.p1 TRINITY_DN769_c0_g1~~TRINITY_DN769_c0_g1_i1.p1  ORF type:complete len:318 (-),score=120.60 TRINITY_DN769_c0_g1_i1:1-954(-)